MATTNIYSLRDFRLKLAEDSTYRANPSFITSQREITGSNVATLKVNVVLTSNQSALTINFNDLKGARGVYVDTDQSVKIVLNASASLIVGLTSAAKTVGRPCFYHEGSITALTVANRIPSALTSVRVIGFGTTA